LAAAELDGAVVVAAAGAFIAAGAFAGAFVAAGVGPAADAAAGAPVAVAGAPAAVAAVAGVGPVALLVAAAVGALATGWPPVGAPPKRPSLANTAATRTGTSPSKGASHHHRQRCRRRVRVD
jgi:hypothetical protein